MKKDMKYVYSADGKAAVPLKLNIQFYTGIIQNAEGICNNYKKFLNLHQLK